MRVRKRGNNYYYNYDIYVNGDRRVIERLGGKTKREAEEKAILEKSNYIKTGIIYDSNMKLKLLIELYLRNYAEIKLKKYTLKNTRLHLETIKKNLGKMKIRDISPIILQQFLLQMEAEDRSSNNYKKCLKGIFSFALKMNILEKNPCTNLIATVKNTKEKELITNDDIKLIVGSSTRIAQSRLMVGDYRNDQVKDLVLLLYLTGLRVGEALGLKFSDVDFDKKELHISRTADKLDKDVFDIPKTKGSIRRIELNDVLIEIIKNRKNEVQRLKNISEGNMEIDLIFADVDGKSILQDTLRRYSKKIGIIIKKNFGWHLLRTAHTTELLTKGVGLKLVQLRLGHSSINTTLNHYVSISEGMKQQCIDALDGLYEIEN